MKDVFKSIGTVIVVAEMAAGVVLSALCYKEASRIVKKSNQRNSFEKEED